MATRVAIAVLFIGYKTIEFPSFGRTESFLMGSISGPLKIVSLCTLRLRGESIYFQQTCRKENCLKWLNRNMGNM
jgi:hypothetical protein